MELLQACDRQIFSLDVWPTFFNWDCLFSVTFYGVTAANCMRNATFLTADTLANARW